MVVRLGGMGVRRGYHLTIALYHMALCQTAMVKWYPYDTLW